MTKQAPLIYTSIGWERGSFVLTELFFPQQSVDSGDKSANAGVSHKPRTFSQNYSKAVTQEIGYWSVNGTDFPFHAKLKELIKMRMIDALSFFAFDKFNLESTKLLHQNHELSHNPRPSYY